MTLKNSYFIANEGVKHEPPKSNNITLLLRNKYDSSKLIYRKPKLL